MRAWIWLGRSTLAADNAKVDDDQRWLKVIGGVVAHVLLVSARGLRPPYVQKSLGFPGSQGHKRLKIHKKKFIN